MKIEEIEIEKLIPYDKNPRVNDQAVNYVVKSIKANGFQQPIVVNKDMVICVGHTRLKAAKEIGMKKVPCVVLDMSREQFIAYNIADNKTSEYASWDKDLLRDNLIELESIDESLLELTAFSEDSLNELMQDIAVSYGDANREYDADSFGSDLDSECPRCGFEFNNRAKK